MRKVVWARPASKDLNELLAYIAEENEQNANLVADRIERTARNLGDFATGRFGRVKDTYEAIVPRTPYVIAYEISKITIVILRVIHSARNWRDGEWPAEDE